MLHVVLMGGALAAWGMMAGCMVAAVGCMVKAQMEAERAHARHLVEQIEAGHHPDPSGADRIWILTGECPGLRDDDISSPTYTVMLGTKEVAAPFRGPWNAAMVARALGQATALPVDLRGAREWRARGPFIGERVGYLPNWVEDYLV